MAANREDERQPRLYETLRHEVVKDQPVELACECTNAACREPISITADEYEFIRRVPDRFVVRIGHVDPASERVIIEEPMRFQVVEKFGPGDDVVAHLDPRRRDWSDPRD